MENIAYIGEQLANQAVREEYIDKKEVARRMKKTPRTIEAWSNQGFLPSLKIGRSRLYSWADIQAHLKANHRA